jgi:hypothetical protein
MTMNELEKKVSLAITEATFETVDLPEEQYEMMEKINFIYKGALDEYMNSPAVVKFNFLEWLKSQTVGIQTKDEFKSLMETILATMETNKVRTRTEKIEYRLARKIYKDVAFGQGQRYEVVENKIDVDYDGQTVQFKPITFKDLQDMQDESETVA